VKDASRVLLESPLGVDPSTLGASRNFLRKNFAVPRLLSTPFARESLGGTVSADFEPDVRVFLSVGYTEDEAQSRFRDAVISELRLHHLDPHTPHQTDFAIDPALKAVCDEMRRSKGTVVLAHKRIFIEKGFNLTKPDEPLDGRALATPWNHIEAALAWSLGHPLLILQEEGLVLHGLLEHQHDWHVHVVEITKDGVLPLATRQIIKSWAEKVRAHETENGSEQAVRSEGSASSEAHDVTRIRINEVAKSLTLAQASSAGGTILLILLTVFGLGMLL
jgi:hypothetical protein